MPRAVDDRGVVLVDDDLLGLPEVLQLDVLELDAQVLGDGLAAGQRRDVLQHGLPPIAEARGLDRAAGQRAPKLVHDQRGQRLAFDVLRDDEEWLARAGHLLEEREHDPSSR